MTTNEPFELLHARRPLILAHRGWSAAFPENTLHAFHEALVTGVDGLEFDVQLTADGEVVVIHDADVARTTNGVGLISSLNYTDIQTFNAAARWTSHAPEPIPTLKQVLDLAQENHSSGLYNIELKPYGDNYTKLVEAVASVTEQHPLKPRILFSSFNHDAVAYLKRTLPDAQIGLLFEDEVPDAWKEAIEFEAYSVNMDYRTITREFVDSCHQYGIKVASWTVDKPADLNYIRGTGADIVITNCVDVSLQTLRVLP